MLIHSHLIMAFIYQLYTGANDSSKAELNPKQHIPLDEYRDNLSKIVDFLQSRYNSCPWNQENGSKLYIVVIAPPPVHSERWRKRTIGKY